MEKPYSMRSRLMMSETSGCNLSMEARRNGSLISRAIEYFTLTFRATVKICFALAAAGNTILFLSRICGEDIRIVVEGFQFSFAPFALHFGGSVTWPSGET